MKLRGRSLSWAVLFAALIVRLLAWDAYRESALFAVAEDSGHDRALYHHAAEAVAAGTVWPDEAFAYLPLYPWLLGAAYAVFGTNLAVAGGLGIGLDLLAVGLVLFLARRFGAGPVTSAIAGLLYALYPLAILYGFVTMPNTLNAVLIPALVLSFSQAGSFSLRRGLAVGALAGMASLGFAGALVMTVAGLLVVAVQERRAAVPGVLAAVAVMAVVLTPVLLHNARHQGQWTGLTTHSGFNLYMGNHERATGYPVRVRDFRMSARDLLADAHAHAEAESGRALTEAENSAWWQDQAGAFWRENTGQAVGLTVKKLFLFWNHREVDDLRLVEQFRLLTGHLARPPWPDFLLIGTLGLAGLLLLPGQVRAKAMTLAGLAGLVAFFITARYRLAFAPVLLAMGMAGVSIRLSRRDWKHLVPVLAVSLAVGLIPVRIPDQSGVDAYNASLQLLQEDRLAEADELLVRSVRTHPGNPNLRHALGTLRFRQERFDEAAEAFGICADLEPGHPNARYNQGLSLARAGRLCEGLKVLQRIPHPDNKVTGLMQVLAEHCR